MKRWWVCTLIASACGGSQKAAAPPLAPKEREIDAAVDTLIAAANRGDGVAIVKMLAPSVMYGGLWFSDRRCNASLSATGTVMPKAFDEFARCLATLRLARSTRTGAMRGVAVLTYEPGIEIEVAFDGVGANAKLRWIGYAGRRGVADNLPTVTPAALEARRTGGTSTAPADGGTTWLKICIDENGKVASVHPRAAPSIDAHTAAVEMVKTWTFRPFTLDGQPRSVCSLIALGSEDKSLPVGVPDAYGDAIILAPSMMERNRTAGDKNIVPGDDDKGAIRLAGSPRIVGSFVFCVDPTGQVGGITMIRSSGIPRYDMRIARALAAWRYSPFMAGGRAFPVCSVVTFIYTQR